MGYPQGTPGGQPGGTPGGTLGYPEGHIRTFSVLFPDLLCTLSALFLDIFWTLSALFLHLFYHMHSTLFLYLFCALFVDFCGFRRNEHHRHKHYTNIPPRTSLPTP